MVSEKVSDLVLFRFWVFWVRFRFRNVSVSKLFNFFGSFGFGIEKIWYQKKYRIRYRKKLVSKKVSDSVSDKFGIGKKFRIRFRSNFGYCHTLLREGAGKVKYKKKQCLTKVTRKLQSFVLLEDSSLWSEAWSQCEACLVSLLLGSTQ